jgi:flagellar biosynthesis GTPase FlhF
MTINDNEFEPSDKFKSYIPDMLNMKIEPNEQDKRRGTPYLKLTCKLDDLRHKNKVIQMLNMFALNHAMDYEQSQSAIEKYKYKVFAYTNAIDKIKKEYGNYDLIHVNSLLNKKIVGKSIAERLNRWVKACVIEDGVLYYPFMNLSNIPKDEMMRMLSDEELYSNEVFHLTFKKWPMKKIFYVRDDENDVFKHVKNDEENDKDTTKVEEVCERTLNKNSNVFVIEPYPSDSSEVSAENENNEDKVNVLENIKTIEKRIYESDVMIKHMLNEIKSDVEKVTTIRNKDILKTPFKVQENVTKTHKKRSWFGKVLKVATSILCVSIAIEIFNMRTNYNETETCT